MSPAVEVSVEATVAEEIDQNNNIVDEINNLNDKSGKKQQPTNSVSSPSCFIKREKCVQTSISKTNLYIRGLEERTTDEDLFELCKRFGCIKSTKAIVDKETNKCKGYGFVDFRSPYDAQVALNVLKKEQRDVQLAKQREQDPTNLYFANLPPDVDEKSLNDLLKNRFNANICSTRIMREESGDSKGVGFCRVDSDKLCARIIQELHSRPFPDHPDQNRQIMVKLADSSGFFKPRSGRDTKHSLNSTGNSFVNGSFSNNNSSESHLHCTSIGSDHAYHHPSHHHQYVDPYGYPMHFMDSYPTTPTIAPSSMYPMPHQTQGMPVHSAHMCVNSNAGSTTSLPLANSTPPTIGTMSVSQTQHMLNSSTCTPPSPLHHAHMSHPNLMRHSASHQNLHMLHSSHPSLPAHMAPHQYTTPPSNANTTSPYYQNHPPSVYGHHFTPQPTYHPHQHLTPGPPAVHHSYYIMASGNATSSPHQQSMQGASPTAPQTSSPDEHSATEGNNLNQQFSNMSLSSSSAYQQSPVKYA